jgi:hypothetical protein
MNRASLFKRFLALDLAATRPPQNHVSPLAEQLGFQDLVRLRRSPRGTRSRDLNIDTLEQRTMFAASELLMNSMLPTSSVEMERMAISHQWHTPL